MNRLRRMLKLQPGAVNVDYAAARGVAAAKRDGLRVIVLVDDPEANLAGVEHDGFANLQDVVSALDKHIASLRRITGH